MRLYLVLFAAVATSCASVPGFRYDGKAGTVLADDPVVAANVAAALDELAPLVKSDLDSQDVDLITVHVVEMNAGRGSCVYDDPKRTLRSRIELSRDLDTEKQRRFALYHELVHWYGQGTWIKSLPLYIEEGVADYLACESIGAVETRRVEKSLPPGTTLDLTQLDTVTPREWQKADDAQVEFMYRAGFDVVYRIGIPRLREAASIGPLSPADVLRLLEAQDAAEKDAVR